MGSGAREARRGVTPGGYNPGGLTTCLYCGTAVLSTVPPWRCCLDCRLILDALGGENPSHGEVEQKARDLIRGGP